MFQDNFSIQNRVDVNEGFTPKYGSKVSTDDFEVAENVHVAHINNI